MHYGLKSLVAITISLASLNMNAQEPPQPASQVKAITAIGKDIAALKTKFPQLAEFSVSRDVQSRKLLIEYDYHTHESRDAGGISALLPNPNRDGVWFRIDFHDPASTLQIHTQPIVPPYCFEDKKFFFLILEGKRTNPLENALWTIFLRHGVKLCPGAKVEVQH